MTHVPPTLGHVNLKVTDLDKSIAFYHDVVGLEVQTRSKNAAFMSFDGHNHHLELTTLRSKGASSCPPPKQTGLYHSAFHYPSRAALGQAVIRAYEQRCKLREACDRGVSEAVYLCDPDGYGVELYCDRAPDNWPRAEDGSLEVLNDPLDLPALMSEGRKGLDA